MSIKPKWMADFKEIIEETRKSIVQIELVEEKTLKYAIIRMFSRAVLSMCEIYTLLNNGYPKGALALSRQLYEAMVIMAYLVENEGQDEGLVERFFDDIIISKLQIEIEKRSPEDEENKLIGDFCKKYSNYCNNKGELGDYWWAGKSFTKIAESVGMPKKYMYKEASKVIHASSYNALVYIKDKGDVLIGATYEGIEKPAAYSLGYFCIAMDLFQNVMQIDLANLLEKTRGLAEMIKSLPRFG